MNTRTAKIFRMTALLAEMHVRQVETQRARGWRSIRAAWRFWRAAAEFDRLCAELDAEIPPARTVRP